MLTRNYLKFIWFITVALIAAKADAQFLWKTDSTTTTATDSIMVNGVLPDSTIMQMTEAELFVWAFENDSLPTDSLPQYEQVTLPKDFFTPAIYTNYQVMDTLSFTEPLPDLTNPATKWINQINDQARFIDRFRQNYWLNHLGTVKYNVATLPEPPKKYEATVDAESARIIVKEITIDKSKVSADATVAEVKRKNWLTNFDFALQFSQAYISPNWYQGGNNNLNMLINAVYSIKLNTAFHPELLFETTAQYKLAMNSAPDDTLRSYNISQDMFQINSKFGYKAIKHWYYTVTFLLKTPIFHGYKSNTRNLTAALFSPGEINFGLGMSYSYQNPKKTFTFGASISPMSYNLKTILNSRMPAQNYGIEAGHKTASQIGSSAELTWTWKMAYNITYTSRLFSFTDYDYLQGDWQNTFTFNINRYLSTNLFIDLRYDSSKPRMADSNWHLWQLKEILSFGFSYKM